MKGLLTFSRQIPEFAACAGTLPGQCALLTGLSHIHKALFAAGLSLRIR